MGKLLRPLCKIVGHKLQVISQSSKFGTAGYCLRCDWKWDDGIQVVSNNVSGDNFPDPIIQLEDEE